MSDSVFLQARKHAQTHGGPRYFIEGHVDGFAFALPMHMERFHSGGLLREVYRVEVGDHPLECQALTDLPDLVLTTLRHLSFDGRLPRYAFQVSATPHVHLLPVYPGSRGWRVYESEGPVFEAGDLGILRSHLAAYLAVPPDHLTVLALSPELRWMPPLCIIQPVGGESPWLPVFALNGTLSIRVDGHEFAVPRNGGEELLALREQVASHLVQGGLVHDGHDLMVTHVVPEQWAALAPCLRPHGVTLGYYNRQADKLQQYPLPVYENKQELVAAYCHTDGLTLVLGADLRSLRRRVGDVLWKQGLLSSPEHLVMEK